MAKKEAKKKRIGKREVEKSAEKIIKKKENQQLIWFFAIIAIVFASFLGTYFYVQSLKTFSFAGIDWIIEDYKNLRLYHGEFPIIYKSKFIANYNIYLRNDPRENNISTVSGLKIRLWPEIIISNSPEAAECTSAARMTGDLGMLFKAFPWVTNVTGAVANQTVAKEYNLSFADCSTGMQDYNKTIIIIKKFNENGEITSPKILKEENSNCYAIYIGDCKNVRAVERFMIELINQMPTETKII